MPGRLFLIALSAISLAARLGVAASCDPSGADAAAVAAARTAVDGACNCNQPGQTHGQYVSCASSTINASPLRPECRGTVRRCYARSTCGKPGFVTCCRTTVGGTTKCSVKRDAAHCRPPAGGSSCVGSFQS